MFDAALEPRLDDAGGGVGHGFTVHVEAGVDHGAGAGEGADVFEESIPRLGGFRGDHLRAAGTIGADGAGEAVRPRGVVRSPSSCGGSSRGHRGSRRGATGFRVEIDGQNG